VHNAIRFQALYVRLFFVLPALGVTTFVSAYWPWTVMWLDVGVAIIEAYLINGMLALIIGLGHIKTQGHLPHSFMMSDYTRSPFMRCGPEFSSGDASIAYWKACTLQMLLVLPICATVLAAVETATNQSPAAAITYSMRVIRVISILVGVIAVLRVNLAIVSETPGNPLQGHRTMFKLIFIKLIFTFVIVNSIILQPLISNNVIPVDPWLCSSAALAQNETYCQVRLINVVFMFELVVLVIRSSFARAFFGLALC